MSEPTKGPFEPFFEEIRRLVREELDAQADRDGKPHPLLTPEELADFLKVPISWVYEQSRQGNIPVHRIGRYVRFDPLEVIASQREKCPRSVQSGQK